MALRLAFLGPPEITHPGRGDVALTNRKALAMLAFLVMKSGHAHSRESVLGLLWPDLPDADARNNLRVTWSHLRAKLGDDAAEPGDGFLLSTRLEMQFNPRSAHWLDVAEFQALLAGCAQHAHSSRSDCPNCQARLAQAAELYRGDFLAGFFVDGCAEFDEWLTVQRERWRQHMLDVLSELAGQHARAGQKKVAEDYVRRLLQLDPLREDAHRHLMSLLLAQDRRAAALAQFETCKRALADALGVEPDPDTLALAAHIRSGLTQSAQIGKHNLPTPLTRFFGREKEIAALAAHLTGASPRLITLTGSGGVGKTRLALRAAYEVLPIFADGVTLAELAALRDPISVAPALAAALGVREQAGAPTAQLLGNVLRDKQMLLVMDNCEHLLTECATLITQLLDAAPKLRILATSRSPLRVEGELVQRVPSLPAPELGHATQPSVEALMAYDAVQLFVNRAASARANFGLTAANAGAVAQLCHRLDGIPLALELAAARLNVMPVEALAQRLDSRFKLLTSGDAGALPRHRTLQALVGWSYDLLPKAEQALLRQLSAFAGGWTLEEAEAVCGAGGEAAVLDHLIALVDHSLVVFGSDPQQSRYTLLETIRQFASEQLMQAGEHQETHARHARTYAHMVAQAAAQANSPTHQGALTQIELERDNVFAALSWAIQHDANLALSIETNLGGGLQFWEMRGHFEAGRRWLRQLLDATQDQPSPARARALLDAATIEIAKPDFAQAMQYAEESEGLSAGLGDERGRLDAWMIVGRVALLRGETERSAALARACVEMGERVGYKRAVAHGLYELGASHSFGQEHEPAKAYFQQSLRLWREIGDKLRLAEVLNHLATTLDALGEDADALMVFEELETIHRELGYKRGLALVQSNMGCVFMKHGNFERARSLFAEGLLIRREMGVRRGYLYSFMNFASLAACQNQPARAAQLFGAAEALREQIGVPANTGDLSGYGDTVVQIRTALGETRFNLEWSRGRGLTAEQAIDLALCE